MIITCTISLSNQFIYTSLQTTFFFLFLDCFYKDTIHIDWQRGFSRKQQYLSYWKFIISKFQFNFFTSIQYFRIENFLKLSLNNHQFFWKNPKTSTYWPKIETITFIKKNKKNWWIHFPKIQKLLLGVILNESIYYSFCSS